MNYVTFAAPPPQKETPSLLLMTGTALFALYLYRQLTSEA
jgi:hypothetical protein